MKILVAAVLLIFFSSIPAHAWPGSPKADDSKKVTVHLKNGNAMSGVLISEDSKSVTLDWEGSEITLSQKEIATIERGQAIKEGAGIRIVEREDKWAHKNSPVVRMTNGQVFDSPISEVKPGAVTLAQDLGDGAFAYTDLSRDKIESLDFAPVKNPASDKIEAELRQRFPKMRFHQIGLVTLITDAEGSSLTTLKSTLRDQLTTLYLDFHELVKARKPAYQHFVVVFDDPEDYFEYALSDGVPAWLCPGYFLPAEKTLYLVNYFGEKFTGMVYETIEEGRGMIDKEAGALKGQVDASKHAIVDGLAQDANRKIETAFAYMSGIFADTTLDTLRHELTHEFFHDWGLQTIVISEIKQADDEASRKKKELLKSKDKEKKKELLIEILGLRRRQSKNDIELGAANSWFVEGLAEYAATTAVGRENPERLFMLKDARKKNELWPVEQLTVYQSGSFPGVATQAALSGYAQSWSFVSFLMEKRRAGFLRYLERMSGQRPANADDDLKWLLEALGTDLRALEKEWHAHIDAQPGIDDPVVEQIVRVNEILGL